MRILLIHAHYHEKGGEDSVFQQEYDLLLNMSVQKMSFQNMNGWKGGIQFLISIWNVFAAKKIRKKIIEFKPDIIHIHNLHFSIGPLAIRIAKKYKIRVVVTLHNYRLLCPSATLFHKNQIFKDSMKSSFPWKSIRKKVYRNSFLQTFWVGTVNWFHNKIGTWKMVDRYIVLTDFSRQLFSQSYLQIGSAKFIVKSNFVNEQFGINPLRTNAFLFVGRLSEEKGIDVLLKAIVQSSQMLRIVGDGPLESKVKDAATKNPNIIFLGRLNAEEVKREMLQCTALVFPSIWYEGMPMTIIEAFATGTPVIASLLGAMASMIENGCNGLHFKPGDAEDLSKMLIEWNGNREEEKEAYRHNARKSYEIHYTPKKNLEQLLSVYMSVISGMEKNNQLKQNSFSI